MVLGYAVGLGAGMGVASGRAVTTLFDKKKGSFTNRTECAAEHMKNDTNFALKTAVVGGAAAYTAIKKPKFVLNIAKELGSAVGKFADKLSNTKIAKHIAPALQKIAEKVGKNPTKAGVIGMVALAGLYLLNTVEKHDYKQGRIDQKYEDAAKIESQTKNVVLKHIEECQPNKCEQYGCFS